MTPLELFAFVVLPLVLGAGGLAIAYAYVWFDKQRAGRHMGE